MYDDWMQYIPIFGDIDVDKIREDYLGIKKQQQVIYMI